MMADVLEGGCFCGAIRYQASAEVSSTMVCHCRSCRKLAGSPVVAWVTVPSASFRFIRGRPVEFRSTAPVTRSFCGNCGNPLTYQHAERAAQIDITTCSLDDPGSFPPTHHSWLSHDLGWVRFGDGLPTFRESHNEKV